MSTFDLDLQSCQINKSGHFQQFLAFLVTLCLFSYYLLFNHEKIEKCFQFSFYYLVEKMGHWLKADIYLTFYHIICSFHALVLQTKTCAFTTVASFCSCRDNLLIANIFHSNINIRVRFHTFFCNIIIMFSLLVFFSFFSMFVKQH